MEGGSEWIVDADLKDFFGSVEHEKLITLVAQRMADRRVLRLIGAMLTVGSYGKERLFPSKRGTPQGGVISPLLSNIFLTRESAGNGRGASHALCAPGEAARGEPSTGRS